MPAFRSSHTLAAPTFTNFGKRALGHDGQNQGARKLLSSAGRASAQPTNVRCWKLNRPATLSGPFLLVTTGPERRIPRWEHEHLLEAVQRRLDANPQAMRQRRETVEHPFGTMKARMGATHFLTKTLPKVAAEMALSVLAYNLTRLMNIIGIQPLIAAIRA